jgi:signal transduction histidine kinase/ligand-binding sensor domain-containing protein/DNA-binding response OmpR family regulator
MKTTGKTRRDVASTLLIRAISCLLLFAGFLSIDAREKLLPVFHFNRITESEGLTSPEIRSNVVRDRQGFVWFGTTSGLVRYDGYACKVYIPKPNDPHSLPSNIITALHIDRKENLWIGTSQNGLSLFDPQHDNFINFPPRINDSTWLQGEAITCMLEDRAGNMWFGTERGVAFIDMSGISTTVTADSIARKIRFHTFKSDHFKNRINDLDRWDRNSIVAASIEGLFIINGESGKIANIELPSMFGSRLDSLPATSLCWENPARLWIGTANNGLIIYDKENKYLRCYHKATGLTEKLHDDYIFDIQVDRMKRLWVATNRNLDCFDISSGKYIEYLKYSPAPADSEAVYHLSLDDAGTLWASTAYNGLYYLPLRSFRFPHYGLKGTRGIVKEMGSIDSSENGLFWFGTEGEIVQCNLSNFNVISSVALSGRKSTWGYFGVSDSYDDGHGTIWYCSWGGGLFRFEPARRKVTTFAYSSRGENLCWTLTGADDNTLWIAAYSNGLLKFDQNSCKYKNASDIMLSRKPNNGVTVQHVMKDPSGKIWIGDERNGLFILDPAAGTTQHFEHDPNNPRSLSHNCVRRIYRDSQGRIWIGSNMLNLWEPETKSFKQFPNEAFYNILTIPIGSDDNGRLWLCDVDKGFSVLDPVSGTFANFDYSDGIFGESMDMQLLPDGRAMLVGTHGLNIVHPDSLLQLEPPPPFVITQMTINDSFIIPARSIAAAATLDLSYRENVLEFEFAAIDPGATHLIEYLYRLEGLEDSWVKPADRRFVRYPGLSPGNYVFRVKAVNKHGRWKNQEIALAFSIAPPWWRTWWSYAAYGFIFIGLFYTGYRLRLRQVRLQQLVEMEQFQTEHLAEVDRLKSRFFANVSHEFRTPLTLILGPLDQLMEKIQDSAIKQKLNLIKDNTKKLYSLVNQLLDFSRIESGTMKLQVSSGDVVKFLRRVAMSFESWAERKKINLEFSSGHESAEGLFDGDKIEKIMNNLISNALKFTPEGGRVDVRVTLTPDPSPQMGEGRVREGSVVRVVVNDTGAGIPPEHLPYIFDRFYRVDDTHATEGTGIGLALTKELIDLHHATITAESTPGAGSQFTVILPIGRSAYTPQEIVDSPGEPETEIHSITVSSTIQSPPAPKVSADGKSVVLIVEDNADLRAYIREFMDVDYSIREASNGKTGYEMAVEIGPDIVISDVMMPEMDGMELCRALKQDVRTSHVPVILLTARAGTDSRIEGLEIGADDYVTKPFDSKELLARVKNLIEQRKQLRKKFSSGVVLKPGEVAVTSLDDTLLKKIMDAVEKNMGNEGFGVDDLAKEACLSRTNLNRKVHALTNLSPAEFIRYVRLQRAREMLEKDAGSVAEIAFQVGFGSSSYFTACFHERFGIIPSEIHHRNHKL